MLRTIYKRTNINDYIFKRDIVENSIRNFRDLMNNVDWNLLKPQVPTTHLIY